MNPSSNNYTKEVMGCLIWILLFVGLFYSGVGNRILDKIRPVPAVAGEAFPPYREWQLADGTAHRGRVIDVDEGSGEVLFESEEEKARNTIRLDSFSPEDQKVLLRAANKATPP